jgi:hypothetical protein
MLSDTEDAMYRPDLAEQYAAERQQQLLAEAASARRQGELRRAQLQLSRAAQQPRSLARWFVAVLRNRPA